MTRHSLSLLFASSLSAFAAIPAFPGAEGYGAYATGGRGGDVYHVTNLSSSGAGSFADAIATVPSAGRTIVFDVSGYIRLPSGSSGTRMTTSKVTIAGQTAPGDGVGFYNNFFRISGDDVIIRHLRFRHGKYGSGGDCIDLDSGSLNSILDHVSMEFSTDENMSSYGSPPENLTLQYSLNSWGLESHSCGGLWDQNHASAHHNLWSHNHTRNPKSRPSGLLEWINNVTFDWDIGFIMGDTYTPSTFKANVRSNYFICPPGNTKTYMLEKGWLNSNATRLPTFSVYLDNNLMDRDGDGVLNGAAAGYERVQGSEFDAAEVVPAYATTADVPRYYKNAAPFTGSTAAVTIDTPLVAYKKVASQAGALRLDSSFSGGIRDEVDTILLNKLTTQTHFHVTRESDTGASASGFGVLASTAAPIDSDRDGMPDSYETALGWNAAVQDHNTTVTGTTFLPAGTAAGYTRLEEYLHFMAIPHTLLQKSTATTIDLSRYTSGFSNTPIFTISSITGGTATQSGTGNKTVTFTAQATAGRGGFLFTVTDADGSTWTQQFAVCATNSGLPSDLNWRGNAGDWDTTASNWLKSSTPSTFSGGDRVTFNDAGSAAPTVNLPGAVTASTVDVNSSTNYAFSGVGSISATSTLTKRGSGTLTINNAGSNSFGSVSLDEGLLSLASYTAAGSGKMSLNGGSLSLPSAIGNALEFNSPTTITVGSQQTMGGNWTGSQPVTINGTSSYLWTLSGTWTGFTGVINFGTGNIRMRLNGNSSNTMYGSTAVAIDLGGGSAQFMNRNGSTTAAFDIGSLAATGTSTQLSGTQTGTVASTYSIGALNTNTTFAGSIANGSGITNINKVGSGTWTLSGTSTHTGNTAVNAGSLFVNGALNSSPTTVASGAMLGGSGNFGALVTANTGSVLAPGTSTGATGTFTAGAGLTLAGTTTLNYDLSNSTTTGNDKITVSSGTLTLNSATVKFNVNLLNGVLSSGTYNLIDGAATLAANPAPTLELVGLPSGARQSFTLNRPSNGANPAYVDLVVSGTAPASIIWTGTSGGGLWDLNATGNFSGGPTTTFYNFDIVTFNDTSTVGNVILNGTLQPRTLTITNNTRAYTWTGNGMISGSTSLTKTGTNTLTITPNMITVSSATTAASNSITVTDATGLTVGMTINGGGFAYGTTITAISGTTLTTSNTTATTAAAASITYHAHNSFTGGTTIGTGSTIQLGNEAANRWGLGTGAITFNGGTLIMAGTSGSNGTDTGEMPNALVVPTGQIGNLQTPQRGRLSGKLTGGGTLNVAVKYVRGDFYGDWSAFTGQINITAQTGSDFRMAENYAPDGFPNAAVNLGASVVLKHVGILSAGAGTSISIGELSGAAGSTLCGGVTAGRALTYVVGGKNTNATFAGAIAEQTPGSTLTNITKTGTGIWTLAGTSTWAGGTLINQGTIAVTGAVTSTGAVNVASGATLQLANGTLASDAINLASGATLTGYGTATADLNCNGTLEGRGFSSVTPGTLSVAGNANFDGATIKMRGGSSSDLITVTGDLNLAGTLQISLASGTAFGRYPLFTYGGNLTLGTVTLTGIAVGNTAQLSTSVAGQVSLVVDDSDEDGLPDSWEKLYFSNLTSGMNDDPDGDGQSNAVEYLAGTNPKNSASRLAATIALTTGNQFTLTWPSVPGKKYDIQTNPDLSGTWQTLLSTLPAAASPATSTSQSISRNGNQRFYRVVVRP